MGYGITSESQLIDISTICAGCDTIDEGAEYFDTCSKVLLQASETCDKTALSIDGKSMQQPIEELSTKVAQYGVQIKNVTALIRKQAQDVYNAQVAELQEYYAYLASLQTQKGGAENGQI